MKSCSSSTAQAPVGYIRVVPNYSVKRTAGVGLREDPASAAAAAYLKR